MSKDKVAPHARDLENHIFLVDLDDTITQTSKRSRLRTPNIEFVTGAFEFIADIHARGAHIAVVSHSVDNTPYAEAAFKKLNEMGINNIPYVSLSDAMFFALETGHAKTEEVVMLDEDYTQVIFKDDEQFLFLDNHGHSNKDLVRFLLSELHRAVIKAIGKGSSYVMGHLALERLGITDTQYKDMTICTVGDAITDVMQAGILKEKFKFKKAFAFFLEGSPENVIFTNLAKNLQVRYAPYDMRIWCLVKLREKEVVIVHNDAMPTTFNEHEWLDKSRKSKALWEGIYNLYPRKNPPTKNSNINWWLTDGPYRFNENSNWMYRAEDVYGGHNKMTLEQVKTHLKTPFKIDGQWYFRNQIVDGVSEMVLDELKQHLVNTKQVESLDAFIVQGESDLKEATALVTSPDHEVLQRPDTPMPEFARMTISNNTSWAQGITQAREESPAPQARRLA